jgi:hypothetical protein
MMKRSGTTKMRGRVSETEAEKSRNRTFENQTAKTETDWSKPIKSMPKPINPKPKLKNGKK